MFIWGNTGVLLVISRMILKMMNDVNKPALAGLWPSQNGMNVVLDLEPILNAVIKPSRFCRIGICSI